MGSILYLRDNSLLPSTQETQFIDDVALVINWGYFDHEWLYHRINSNDAVIQGNVYFSNPLNMVRLNAPKVFLSLPDQTRACLTFNPITCPSGEVFTYNLTPNRCLIPLRDPCTPFNPDNCSSYPPPCPENYPLLSFPSKPDGCYIPPCFPDFVDLQ
eukprot:TRINITY_DN5938_c0_g3_i4.p1 TRINITY_DN5938_c0_g3~~TRINITY_DN5938_c0_g3_i4.p1  ORF type:complete len:157 (-),score=12.73 TRINITY_DN5938_c0_g3_i4:178-648(-)